MVVFRTIGSMYSSSIHSPSFASHIMWWYSCNDFVSRVVSSRRRRRARMSFLERRAERPRTW